MIKIGKIKVLNLYAGIGGNRKLWPNDEIEVTAVEINESIATIYKDFFPNDNVIVGDAHQYLLDHFKEYDFIWASPPCPTHSQFRFRCGVKAWDFKAEYPNMNLYEEIIFLKYYFNKRFVVENTESYYKPLIPPKMLARHYFWSNFPLYKYSHTKSLNIKTYQISELQKLHNIYLSKYKIKDKRQILRNCVDPNLGLHIFNCAFKEKQTVLTLKNDMSDKNN